MYWYEGRSSRLWIRGLNTLGALCVGSIVFCAVVHSVLGLLGNFHWSDRPPESDVPSAQVMQAAPPALASAPPEPAPQPAAPPSAHVNEDDDVWLNYKPDFTSGKPADWQLQLTNRGKNVTFTNQRLEVGQVDTTATLTRSFDFSKRRKISLIYTQNVGSNHWGMGATSQLRGSDGSAIVISLGKTGFGKEEIKLVVQTLDSRGTATNRVDQILPISYGEYFVSATFMEGKFYVFVTRPGKTGQPELYQSFVPGLNPSVFNSISFSVSTTTGESQWIKDIQIAAWSNPN
jgi:hypothetical protein